MNATSISTNNLPWSDLVAQAMKIGVSTCRGLPNPIDDGSDVAQDALLKALSALPSVPDLRCPAAMVTRITRNSGLDRLRGKQRHAQRYTSIDDVTVAVATLASREPNPEECLLEKRRPTEDPKVVAIRAARETLRITHPREARVLDRLEVEEAEAREVAAEEEVTLTYLYKIKSRGLERLGKLVAMFLSSARGSPGTGSESEGACSFKPSEELGPIMRLRRLLVPCPSCV
jgi:DNA-directed RNA polymerase specialized sigma24 family protein